MPEFDFSSLAKKEEKVPPKPVKLHPPPKPVIPEEVSEIDFENIAKELVGSSDFMRMLVFLAKKMFPNYKFPSNITRKSNIEMTKDFNNSLNDLNSAVNLSQEIKSLPRELLTELKDKLHQKNFGLIKI